MAKLIIYEDIDDAETVFETFDLSVSRILIGSDPDNHLILEAPNIDPAHASLELRDNTWILQDLGAPGGTFVNGNEIEGPCLLHHQDLIGMGQIKMRFQALDTGSEPEIPRTNSTSGRAAESHVSGRIWFATIAGGTIALIFVILFLLVVADYLDVIKITDLLPPWLVG